MNLIKLTQGTTTLVLYGSGAGTAFKGAVLRPASGDGLTIEEEIIVSLAGSTSDIENAIRDVGRLLSEAQRVAALAGMDYVFLEAQVASGGTTYRSKVLRGWVEMLGSGAVQRLSGSQGIKVVLVRANYWESSTETSLSLSSVYNPGGTAAGARAHNTWDATNGNYVHLAATALDGDLPCPARLDYDSNYGSQGTLYTGQNVSSDPANAALSLECEDGVAGASCTKTDYASATASDGDYCTLAWSGATDTELLNLVISSGLATDLAGWPFLPVLRLYATAASGLWCYWRIVHEHVSGNNTLAESRPAYLDTSGLLQAGSPLHIPPWQVDPDDTQPGLLLQLWCKADTVGAHSISADNVFLLPLEYWRIYKPSIANLSGLDIEDDGYRGIVKSHGTVQGHNAEGPGFWLWPGRAQRFYFLMDSAAGVPIANYGTVRIYARPRRRML